MTRNKTRIRYLVSAVRRLYRSQPPVKQFTMRLGKDRIYRRGGYTWYREPWMDEILNAYRNLGGRP